MLGLCSVGHMMTVIDQEHGVYVALHERNLGFFLQLLYHIVAYSRDFHAMYATISCFTLANRVSVCYQCCQIQQGTSEA
jgi:hypothetical protein